MSVVIEKVSCFPNEGKPMVLAGALSEGDIRRVTMESGGVIYERYTPPAPPADAPVKPVPVTKEVLLAKVQELLDAVKAI